MIISKSILTTFEESNIFWGRWGSSENSPEPKHYKFHPSLACPNPWIALYLHWGHFFPNCEAKMWLLHKIDLA